MNKRFRKKEYRRRDILFVMTGSLLFVLILTATVSTYYKFQVESAAVMDNTVHQNYKYHFALVTENYSDSFWKTAYEGAKEAGKDQGAYVELIGKRVNVSYELSDLLEIAIYEKVDGILVEPNGEERVTELINEAVAAGIPVITVLKDDTECYRQSFVGINSYYLGQAFGRQLKSLVSAQERKAVVLMNEKENESGQNLIFLSIKESVAEEQLAIEAVTVNRGSTFSSEEAIRNIIIKEESIPDILVCLNAEDTRYAYQMVVDYNKVGDIDIIGYYDEQSILSAIQKKIIHSTVSIDAREMGKLAVEAALEYKENNRISDYISVNIDVIDVTNVSDFLGDISDIEK